MSRGFAAASTEALVGGATATTTPITISALFNCDSLPGAGGNYTIASLADNSAASLFSLYLDGDESDQVGAACYTGTWYAAFSTSAPTSTGTWYHAAGVWTNSTSRAAFLDGGNKGTNANSCAPSGIDNTHIGALYTASTWYYPFDGKIAEVGIWNVALTDTEIALLGNHYSPLLIRPQSLIAYLPLIRDADEDLIGGVSFSVNATPTVNVHARVFYPSPRFISFPSAGGTTYTVQCSDGIGVDDTDRGNATYNVIASDGLNVTDIDRGAGTFPVIGSDSIALDDLTAAVLEIFGVAADSITLNDTALRLRTTFGMATDGIAADDTAAAIAGFLAAAADGIVATDTAAYTILGAVEAFAADGIAVTDAAVGAATLVVRAGDAVTVDDTTVCTFTVQAVAADGVALSDAISVQVAATAQAVDNIELADAARALGAYIVAATDGIAVSDVSIQITGNLATGILTVSFTTKKGAVTLTVKRPGVDFAVKRPDVNLN